MLFRCVALLFTISIPMIVNASSYGEVDTWIFGSSDSILDEYAAETWIFSEASTVLPSVNPQEDVIVPDQSVPKELVNSRSVSRSAHGGKYGSYNYKLSDRSASRTSERVQAQNNFRSTAPKPIKPLAVPIVRTDVSIPSEGGENKINTLIVPGNVGSESSLQEKNLQPVGDKVLITKPKHTTSIVYQKEIHYAVVSKRESNITTLEGAGIISRAIFEKSTKGMGAIILFSFFIPIAFFWLMIHPEYSFRLGRLQQKLLYRIFHLK